MNQDIFKYIPVQPKVVQLCPCSLNNACYNNYLAIHQPNDYSQKYS